VSAKNRAASLPFRPATSRAEHFRLYFDGGSRGNPGPSYGSYRLQRVGAALEPPIRLTFGKGTNNVAEYLALIGGLRGLRVLVDQAGLKPSEVALQVMGDSMLVIEQMSGRWKVKDQALRVLWEEAQDLVQDWAEVQFVRQPRRRSVALLGH